MRRPPPARQANGTVRAAKERQGMRLLRAARQANGTVCAARQANGTVRAAKERQVMRLLRPLAALFLAAALCLVLCGCQNFVCTLLSVRLRAEEGVVTAAAYNEFSLDGAQLPVTLTLYYADEETNDPAAMTAVAQAESGDLDMGQQLEASAPIRAGWYCAVLEYAAGGEARTLQSGTVRYAEDGTRL